MKVYIAGPMRGKPFFNFPQFDEAYSLWKYSGHDPISPAQLDRDAGFDPSKPIQDLSKLLREVIVRDVQAVCQCEAIALLPGWEGSSGCKVEIALGKYLGLKFFDAFSMDIINPKIKE